MEVERARRLLRGPDMQWREPILQWHSVKGGVVRCERSPRKLQWDILIAVKNKGLGDGMETTLEIWPSVWKNGDISMPHKVGEKKMGKRKELILDNLLLRC